MWSVTMTCAALMTSWGSMVSAQGNSYHIPEPPVFLMKAPPKPPWITDDISCPHSELVILSSPDPAAASEWPASVTHITTVGLAMGVTILMVLFMLVAAFFVYKWHKNKIGSQKVSPKKIPPDSTNYQCNYHVNKYTVPPVDRNSTSSAALSVGEHSSLVRNEAGLKRTGYLRVSPHKDRLSLESNSSGIGTCPSEPGDDEDYVTLEPQSNGHPIIAMHQPQLPTNLLPPVIRRHAPPHDPHPSLSRKYQTISESRPGLTRTPASHQDPHPTGSLRRVPLSPQPIMGLKARAVTQGLPTTRAVTQGLPTTSLRVVRPAKEQDLVLDPVLLNNEDRKSEARPLRRKHHRHRNSDSYFSDTEGHSRSSRRMAVKYIKNADSDAENRDAVYMNRDAASESEA